MKKPRVWILATTLVLAGLATWWFVASRRSAAPAYRFAAVERGSVESTISTTGKLGAVTTVQVGTQVSGQVSGIFADFNDHVKKGQLIATIDPTLQRQAVREAEAGLERNVAEMTKAQRDFTRDTQLHERQMISDSEFGTSEYAFAVAQSSVKSGRVTLDRARRNLAYTSIYAPIDGIVIERNVDVGQTVAASLSAPQIFLIANDLSRMQILAAVDESDVGRIHEGQSVRFTVQSAPSEKFTGTVRQVRLQSATVENVVNYTAVIAVENPNGKLLPGMTATVTFLIASARDVLLVPNAALRIRATAAMLAQAGGTTRARSPTGATDSTSAGASRGDRAARTGSAATAGASRSDSLLWYQGADGKLKRTRVRAGISDGQKTEVRAEGIVVGTMVLIGTQQGASSASSSGAATASPFQQQSQQRSPGSRGGF
jgi:HlyD family secretion protein